MDDRAKKLQAIFVQNRAEELGFDVWESFVVPPFFDVLDLQEATKPRVIVGGRGYGKTMLLRYLSHESTFSPKRVNISRPELTHIGLYWRADTQFVTVMAERGQTSTLWAAAFNHLIALDLAAELLKSLQSMARSRAGCVSEDSLSQIDFSRLASYDAAFKGNTGEFAEVLRDRTAGLEMWVSNAETGSVKPPVFLPGTRFLKALIACLKAQVPALRDAVYSVYVDEFENFLEYQQRVLNTCLKHSEPPLIFNVAMKRHGFKTSKTIGEESIIDPADYRTHDLDQYLHSDDFPVFAAEVLFLHMRLADFQPVPIEVATLRDPAQLSRRKDKEYRERVLGCIRNMLPGLSHDQLAIAVFETQSLKRILCAKVERALKNRRSTLVSGDFLRPDQAKASIVVSALLHRPSLSPDEILNELTNLANGQDNRFTGAAGWVHNNFIGCVLAIYASAYQVCPFYAGFDTFCHMARGNLRHFLELCHQSINRVLRRPWTVPLSISAEEQAFAARQVSAKFLGEVYKFGCHGNKLHNFVLRLGSLFALAHEQPSQSEPERSHFAIVRGSKALSPEEEGFLQAAQMWSVLFVEEETKVKESTQPIGYDYILNPIYSPYFTISYRKIRKLEITYDEFKTLADGSYDEVRALLTRYSKKWSVKLDDADPTLFSHLLEQEATDED